MTDWLAETRIERKRDAVRERIYRVVARLDDAHYEGVRKRVCSVLGITPATLNKARKEIISSAPKKSTRRQNPKHSDAKNSQSGSKITPEMFGFFGWDAEPVAAHEVALDPAVREMFKNVPHQAWNEFFRVTANRVHFAQAYTQCLAFGWPVDTQREFRKLYALVVKSWFAAIARARGVDMEYVYWPVDADADRPDRCKLTVYTAGAGRLLDALFRPIRTDRENDNHVALPAGYTLVPGYPSGDGIVPPKIIRDKSYRWPMVTSGLAPGYRVVQPSEGLLVQSFGDPDRVNVPWAERSDRRDDPSPIRVGVYRDGEDPHRYIAAPKPTEADDLHDAMMQSIEKLHRAFPDAPTDALGYLICRGMLNELDASATQSFVFLVGTSGSGKTTLPMLAGEILGNETVKIAISDDQKDAAQRLGYAFRERTRFICLDEFHLLYQTSKLKERTQVTQIIQQLDRRHRFNAKYRDDETIDAQSVLVMTGTTIPADFASKQLARRTLSYDLPELKKGIDWKRTSGGVSGWRCRTSANKHLCDEIVSRAFDFLSHPDVNFSHLAIENFFGCRRLNEYVNSDVEARNVAYATLYKIWLHSYRRWKYASSAEFQKLVDDSGVALIDDKWGDPAWMHDASVMRNDGWLNLIHPDIAECRIIESIFNRIGPESPASQIVNYFQKEEGEEGFVGLFGFGDEVQYVKLLVRQRGSKVCARFQLWPDERRATNWQLKPEECPDLPPEWDARLTPPPDPLTRSLRGNDESAAAGWAYE